jgi:hypothetical protein
VITFQRENVRDIWPDILPLLVLEHAELTPFPDIPLDIDRDRYDAADALGLLRCYTVRRDGKLVGHAGFGIAGMHHKSTKIVVGDVLYVHPDHRAEAGLGLIGYALDQLQAEGVVLVYLAVKIAHPALGRILTRRGVSEVETVLVKRLDKGA